MRSFLYITVFLFVALIVGCGGHKSGAAAKDVEEDSVALTDSGTIYGLACEGCCDTMVWLLPPDLSDPIGFDIVAAVRKHKIFGKIRTGDGIAVVVNAADSSVADVVIDIDELKGTWCYKVWPTLKRADDLPPGAQEMTLSDLPDSLKKMYYHPVEYGITLKRNNMASPVAGRLSGVNSDEDNPFIYEPEDMYTAWRLLEGDLVLSRQVEQHFIIERDSLDDVADEDIPVHIESRLVHDTVSIELLMEDTLVLRFSDHVQGYYRKK